MAFPSPQRLSPTGRELRHNLTPSDHSDAAQPASIVPDSPAPELTEIPLRLLVVEGGRPFHVINADPVLDVHEAAIVLGVSQDLLEKWRQRDQGPAFIQYLGPGGPVRYELSALEAYKAAHRGQPSIRLRWRRVKA
jgi:hypothetical protein